MLLERKTAEIPSSAKGRTRATKEWLDILNQYPIILAPPVPPKAEKKTMSDANAACFAAGVLRITAVLIKG